MNKQGEPDNESRHYPVEEHMRWQHREWRIQRVGIMLLFLIVVLGACGLFSKGFLSNKAVNASDGSVMVEYERFGRIQSSMDMVIRIRNISSDQFTVTLGRGAMDKLQIQSLHPQPVEAQTKGSDLVLTFAADKTIPDHTVWLGLQPQSPGINKVSVGADSQMPVEFTQWIYP